MVISFLCSGNIELYFAKLPLVLLELLLVHAKSL